MPAMLDLLTVDPFLNLGVDARVVLASLREYLRTIKLQTEDLDSLLDLLLLLLATHQPVAVVDQIMQPPIRHEAHLIELGFRVEYPNRARDQIVTGRGRRILTHRPPDRALQRLRSIPEGLEIRHE